MKKYGLTFIRVIILTIIAIPMLLPIIWMIMSSFKLQNEIFKYSTLSWQLFIPVDWTFQNYVDIFMDPQNPFGVYFVNTLFVALTITTLGLIVNSMAAFAIAKLRLPYKSFFLMLFLSTLAIPQEVLMIPQYLLMQDLEWLNSFKALIIPQIVWAFGIFLLVQFFSEVPRDILDAARMDGASWFKVYYRIVLPTAVPALITLGLVTFVTQWDNFLWPLIVINDDSKQVITVAIASYQALQGISWGKILAAATVSSVPIIIVFLFLQRYYVRGVTMSGVKG